jgi:hypothetical protein
METPSTLEELNALAYRVKLAIASKLEDFDHQATTERRRLQQYYDKRKRELAAGQSPSLVEDGWEDREWWQDNG